MSMTRKAWRLSRYPEGLIHRDDFTLVEERLPEPRVGEMRIRNLLLSIDPTNRVWASPIETYMPRLELGEVMRGLGIGVVEASRHPDFPVGTYVTGLIGWQDRFVTDGTGADGTPLFAPFQRDPDLPLTAYLGLFGFIGLTAYIGVTRIGKAQAGETLVVSAAAGATGSLAGQIGKQLGCRVIGIAGGADKCRRLVEEFGFDAAIDYKNERVAERLAALCPDGVDIYYECVGGEIFEAVLDHLARGARIVFTGQISRYNDPDQPGPRNLVNLILKRARIEAFVVLDYLDDTALIEEAMRNFASWYRAGAITFGTHVVDGLESAPEAVNMLFTGANQGKLMVRLAEDPGTA